MTPRLTRAQRKELRRRGPFRLVAGDLRETGGAIVAEFRYAVHEASVLHGAIVAALNAIATEPEPVARAREALMLSKVPQRRPRPKPIRLRRKPTVKLTPSTNDQPRSNWSI